MSHPPPPDAEITPALVARLLQLQDITLNHEDLLQTTQHVQLLHSHAARVMAWSLEEHIEPAPEFRP